MMISTRALFVAKFLLAFCSLSYELLLAQWMSVLVGHTIVQYSLTIGLFLFSLGVGAWITAFRPEAVAQVFFVAECVICLLMAATPWVGWSAFVCDAPLWIVVTWGYGAVLAVGVITGFELPLFIHRFGLRHQRLILASDYAGAVCASLCFPFVFYYGIGVLAGFPLVTLGNAAALWVLPSDSGCRKGIRAVAWTGVVLTSLCFAAWAVNTTASLMF